jgi:TatD DNase family protein
MDTFYDTHAHLDYPDFHGDFELMLERARNAGIRKVISIGTDLESSRAAIGLAERYGEIFAVVGWHPTNVTAAPGDIRNLFRNLAAHPKVVALGETGLDYYRLPSGNKEPSTDEDARYKSRQAVLFEQHLELAAELGLNCVIHERAAMEDTLKMTERFAGRVRGVFHCFSSGTDSLLRILEMGSIVSFTGIVTFKNAQTVRDSLSATPMDAFMLETDCPYLAPVPYRGKRCEPAYVKEIADLAAQVKSCSLAELSAATCATAERFFPKLAAR